MSGKKVLEFPLLFGTLLSIFHHLHPKAGHIQCPGLIGSAFSIPRAPEPSSFLLSYLPLPLAFMFIWFFGKRRAPLPFFSFPSFLRIAPFSTTVAWGLGESLGIDLVVTGSDRKFFLCSLILNSIVWHHSNLLQQTYEGYRICKMCLCTYIATHPPGNSPSLQLSYAWVLLASLFSQQKQCILL